MVFKLFKMTKRIYVDTCILISFITNELNLQGKTKGLILYTIFEKFYEGKIIMVVSKWTLKELKKVLKRKNNFDSYKYIRDLIDELKSVNAVDIVQWDKEDEKKANELDPENWDDALHIILAEKSHSSLLVTEDINHFNNYSHRITIYSPRELIRSGLLEF